MGEKESRSFTEETHSPLMHINEILPGIKKEYGVYSGKVRDTVDLKDGRLLIVATDRLSAFDVVLQDGIPDKGEILTQISREWFEMTKGIIPNHVISTDIADFPDRFQTSSLDGRTMLVKKMDMFLFEGVVRGYLAGSGLVDYKKNGSISGIQLLPGLREAEKLPKPIFTPSTKATPGVHDENIDMNDVLELLSQNMPRNIARVTLDYIEDKSIELYKFASSYALEKGIIIADTKFEFGVYEEDGKFTVALGDELITPDSSRFWSAEKYLPGRPQESFDKQFVRDWLTKSGWNRKPPAPKLPSEVISITHQKYNEALNRLFKN